MPRGCSCEVCFRLLQGQPFARAGRTQNRSSQFLCVTVVPQTSLLSSSVSLVSRQRVRWARALYDFEALEEDELGFRSGEVVEVLDSSNPSWWTGRLHNKLGLFPANYVAPMMR